MIRSEFRILPTLVFIGTDYKPSKLFEKENYNCSPIQAYDSLKQNSTIQVAVIKKKEALVFL